MKQALLAFTLVYLMSGVTHATDRWGQSQPTIVFTATGFTPQEIYSQIGLIAEGNAPIKKIKILSPDQNIDSLVVDLQQRFPHVVIEVSYNK